MNAFSNANAVVAQLAAGVASVDKMVKDEIRNHGALLETEVKRRASGRPGPQVITGDYRRSITRKNIENGVVVGTNRAQGRRLEFGFVGTDSAGRTYDQPPYPHFGPAVDFIGPRLLSALGDRIDRGIT